MSGTVSKLNVEKGERVVGTIQMTGTELLRIANLNKMEITVDVNENDIVRAKLNDTAKIEVDAYLNQKFKGVVTEIANSATLTGTAALSSDQVTNYQVKIRILNESYRHLLPKDAKDFYPFRPGMSATVDILTKSRSNVLSVPIQAVTARKDTSNVNKLKPTKNEDADKDDSDKAKKHAEQTYELVFVYNQKTKTVEERRVKTGIQDADFIEIVSGLTETDEVVVAPYSAISKKLKDKQKVDKVAKEKLYEASDKK
jgi:HlyD family secretion protein